MGLLRRGTGDESISLTAPSTAGTYYYGACVDEVSSELDTTNNCSNAVTVTVGAPPAPDLVVDSPTVSKSAPTVGASFTLNATVRNQGNGSSGSTTLRYYQSTDSTITTSDTEVGTDSVLGLAASRTGDESISLTAPSTAGTYYYGACVDEVSSELDTTNNCSNAVTVTVGAAPAPDLVVDTPTVSNSAPTAGASFTLNATVRNQGNGSSDSTTLRYYRSTDSTITTGDTEVGTDSVFGLSASRSGDESVSLTAPSTADTYYYGACVDSVTDESDTTNNCSSAVTVTVGATPAPDLVVDTPTVSESAPTAGASFTLNATVRNQGNGSSGSTTLRYYQSTDSTIAASDTEVGTDSVFRLNALATGAESISLTAPSTAGTYYYGACVDSVSDESDTTNNCSVAVTVVIGAVTSEPGAPTGLTATANGQTQIDLSWTAPSDNGGAAITGHRIEVSSDGSNWSGLESDTGSTSTSYSHTGLTAGSTRHYRVSAINSQGTGQASNTDSATTASPASETTSACATDGAVANAASNPGLVLDCETLLAAKDTLRGTATLNWSADTPIASWDAVTVSGTPRRVTRIDTSGENLNLSGTIPAGLGGLSSLTYLRLSNNQLTGAIPAELGNLSNLSSLSLWNNQLTGTIPTELGNLSNLTFLRLSGNELTGAIPAELGNLTKLDSLYLGSNRLSGTIPSEFGNLTNLRHLLLGSSGSGRNQLTGAIPAELKNLTKLQSLDLWKNRISGTIPVWLGDLTDLRTLILAGNQLTGTIPVELGNLTKVNQFWLAHNQLTGTIPSELGNLTSVRELHLNDNRLTGDIPAELAGLSSLRRRSFSNNLSLSNNQLSGCIPEGLRDVAAQHDIAQLGLPDCDTGSSTVVAPGAPTGLTATADGQTEIDLSWTAPSDNGGASITGYKIEVSTNGTGWSVLVANTSSTGASYSHTGLTAGTTRHYRVSAINSAGTGPASSSDSATTEAAPATKPGAPTGLTATADGQTEIDLSWTAPSNDGGASITGYKIEVSTNGSNWSDLVANTRSTGASYSHTGLTAGSTRHYRVSAINSAGTGPASDTDSATTEEESNSAPTAVGTIPDQVITQGTELTVDVSPYFSDPDDDALSYSIWSPQLFNAESVSGSTATLLLTSLFFCDPTTVTITAQDPGGLEATQDFTLRRFNNLPVALSGTFPSQTIDIEETVPLYMGNWFSDPDICDSTLKYSAESSDTGKATVSTSGNTVSVMGEAAGSVTITVVAEDGEGLTATLNIQVTVAAAAATKPGAPTGLTATADGQTEIDLSWTAPSDDGGASITGYKIEVSTNSSSWSDLVANTRSTGASYSHTGLTAGTTRHYRVSAINSEGTGQASNTDSATTEAAPATKPGAPTGLTATADGQTEIDLSWTAPSNDGGASVTGYKIEVSTNGTGWSVLVANTRSTGASYSHTGLTAGTTRHYRVSAINSAGTGTASNTDSATTESSTTPAPTPTPAPTTKAVTTSITECSGRQVGFLIEVTIAGTVTANRAVENVIVTGSLNGDFVGIDILGDIAGGEIVSFRLSGYVSEASGSCGIEVEWLEFS